MSLYREAETNAPPLGSGTTVFTGLAVRDGGAWVFNTWDPGGFDAATYARWRGISVADANLAILNAVTAGAPVVA